MRANYEDNRRHILDAGYGIIARKGFSGVGLSEILQAANVPKGSFYHYFESKEGYGEALLEHYIADYASKLDVLFADAGRSARERLMAYWQSWADKQTSDNALDKCLVVKLAAEVADLSDAMRETLRVGTERLIARIAQCIELGQADGSVRTTLDAHDTAAMLYQLWLGASLLTKLRRDDSALQEALRFTRQTLD